MVWWIAWVQIWERSKWRELSLLEIIMRWYLEFIIGKNTLMHNQLFDAYVFILHRATAGELRRYARVANFRTASDIHLFSLFLMRLRKAFFNCSSCFSKILFNACARLYLSNNLVIFFILMHSSNRHDAKTLYFALRTLNIFSDPTLLNLFLLNWDR